MSQTREKKTDEFKVQGESGRIYTISQYTTQILPGSLSGTNSWMDGSKKYFVSGGDRANKIDDQFFHIVGADESAKRL